MKSLCKVDISLALKWLEAQGDEIWPRLQASSEGDPAKMYATITARTFARMAPLGEPPRTFDRFDGIVTKVMAKYPGCRASNLQIARLIPGQTKLAHSDAAGPGWKTRIHVPLKTNPSAVVIWGKMAKARDNLKVGQAYEFDKTRLHALLNGGKTDRIHFIFDVVCP